METSDLCTRDRRVGEWYGAGSIIASAACYAAFVLSSSWHWELRRLRRSGESPPDWAWPVVNSLKLMNIGLALVAVVLLLLAVGKRSWIASFLAFAMAVLCLWTVAVVA